MKNILPLILLLFVMAGCGAKKDSTANKTPSLDRSKMPEPGPAPEIRLGQFTSFTLDNGLQVFVVENHKLPRVAYRLILDNDPVLQGDAKGYAELAGDLMGRGTKTRTKEELDKEVDMLGASLSTSKNGIYAASLKKYNEQLLELMSDVVLNPDFKESELEKLKKQMISGLATQKDNPDAIASNVEDVVLFGKNHPYGEIMTESTVENVTLDKAKAYYDQYYKPNAAMLAVVGDITPEEARTMVTKYFSNWKQGVVPQAKYPQPTAPESRKVAMVEKRGAVQSVVKVSYPVNLKPGDEDYIPARVMNHMLGGGSSARLFRNLREEKAYTYGAYSSLEADMLVGYFSASAKVRNEVTDSAITEILNEMERLRSEQVDSAELQGAKNNLSGKFAIGLEDPQTIATFALNKQRYNLPDDYYQTYLKKLNAVTAEDIMRVAEKYLHPNNAYIVVAGDGEVRDQIMKFSASNKVDLYDSYGNKMEPQREIPVPEGVTADQVINNYLTALGGRKKLSNVKSLSLEASTVMQGFPIQIEQHYKAPDKFAEAITAGGQIFQKRVYDGKRGKISGMQGEQELEGDILKQLAEEAHIFPELVYEKSAYKTELIGLEKVDGKAAYAIKVESPTGRKTTQYFYKDSGLKAKEEFSVSEGGQTFSQTTFYQDYKPVSGIQYPHTMKIEGSMPMTINVQEVSINKEIPAEKFEIK